MKRIILFLLITLLVTTSSFAAVFNDINNHWAQTSILNAYHNNFVSGYSDGTFKPNNTITRAEFITVLTKLLESSIVIDIDSYDDIFTYGDLPENHWCRAFYNKLIYYGHVFSNESSLIKNKGSDFVISILGDSFRPSEPITRAEAISLIAYFLDDNNLENENTIDFSDIELSSLKDYINKFSKTGIVKGYTDGTFRPDNFITRAEVSKIITDMYTYNFYFKETTWINDSSIKNIYPDAEEPINVFIKAFNYEESNQYHLAYQFLSANYKIDNEIYNYKDYMKKDSSHFINTLLEIEENTNINKKENKDGSITLSFNDINNQTHSIDLILVGEKWYINSKLY